MKIDIEKQKQVQLDILLCVDKFCRENGLRYSLGGGSLLGAVRHKGFIPWDDDIDIMLPRPDYDKFIQGFVGVHPDLTCGAYENDSTWPYPFCKVYNNKTYWKEYGFKMALGIFIDVFPIDGYPGDENKIRSYISKLEFWKYLLVRKALDNGTWKRFFFNPLMTLLPLSFLQKKVKGILVEYAFETSRFVGASLGPYREKECYPHIIFDEYIDMEFEGDLFMGIKEYDVYLRQHYGDYMELPPIEDRVFRHMVK